MMWPDRRVVTAGRRGSRVSRALKLALLAGWLLAGLGMGVAAGYRLGAGLQPATAADTGPGAVIVVSDDHCVNFDGCDSVSVFDCQTLAPIYIGSHLWCSPGRLAASKDLSVIIAQNSNDTPGALQVVEYQDGAWSTRLLRLSGGGPGSVLVGAPALTPEGDVLLVSVELDRAGRKRGVAKYLVDEIGESALGPRRGLFPVDGRPYEILVSKDGRLAHVVVKGSTQAGGATLDRVYTLDIASMQELAPPVVISSRDAPSQDLGSYHATISPDERWLVTNYRPVGQPAAQGQSDALVLVDLQQGEARRVSLPGDTPLPVYGVAFNHAARNHGLLAVNRQERVELYEMSEKDVPALVASKSIWPVVAKKQLDGSRSIVGSIGWDTTGEKLIAADGMGFVVLRVGNEGRELEELGHLIPCADGLQFPNDVLTANAWIVVPTPTPTATPTVTATPSPTSTLRPSPTPSPTRTPTRLPTRTPAPTSIPGPLYLPILLREHCAGIQQRADIVLVLDASSSMAGSKLAAAKAAALAFIQAMELPEDQVAVVAFNQQAWLVHELSADAGALVQAIEGIEPLRGTRIDRGLTRALAELGSERRKATNEPVIVLLTDGIQYEEPQTAPEVARQARDGGVTIYAVGLGADVDESYLVELAGGRSRYYYAPDEGQLVAIYEDIARTIPCPPERFWGRRRDGRHRWPRRSRWR